MVAAAPPRDLPPAHPLAGVRVDVAVELPKHGGLADLLSYQSAQPVPPGSLVCVPLGKRVVRGVAWAPQSRIEPGAAAPAPQPLQAPPSLRDVVSVATTLAPLSASWRRLVEFAAAYYQRSLGELCLAALPPRVREVDDAQLARLVAKVRAGVAESAAAKSVGPVPALTTAQRAAVDAALAHVGPTLLFGATGSGKTEVYLHAAQAVLAQGKQVLVLVPEINLTPQLEARLAARFSAQRLVTLHSALTPARRAAHWLQAHLGAAQVVLGTRLAVFASMPQLGLIVVDEEHDPSFKQQEGARYSARDLAVYRGQLEAVPVVLGSATPSLESWRRAQEGRYRLVSMPERMGSAAWPRVKLVDMNAIPREVQRTQVLAPALMQALRDCRARGEQSLVLLNRRGFAPVLHCNSCSWKSECPHCSAWRVFHKADRSLRCHHCGLTTRVPTACPSCGDMDIAPIGRGTQKLQEQLTLALPGARIERIDADSVRTVGALQAQLAAVHDGDVDVLVGTQMVAKGHDFRRVALVAVIDTDGSLFSSDFRAPERLFSLLMQAAGRAGRDAARQAQHAEPSTLWVQTWHPTHEVFSSLVRHDFEAFAQGQLQARERAGLPPYTSLALLRADARTVEMGEAFLRAAADAALALPACQGVTLYPPVPLHVSRVADVERLQMLVESPTRAALHKLLAAWHAPLQALRAQHKGVIRFALDVDPLQI
jgi:primosomal protein N' (replication factor Y) (superfamily II helicase)